MTTELGSFDRSRLGAFRASQFGDARNAPPVNQFNCVILPGFDNDLLDYWRSDGPAIFDADVAHFLEVAERVAIPLVNGLIVVDWLLQYVDDFPQVFPHGRTAADLPPGVQLRSVDSRNPDPFDITPRFVSGTLDMLGDSRPPSCGLSCVNYTQQAYHYSFWAEEFVNTFRVARPGIRIATGGYPPLLNHTWLSLLASLIEQAP